MADWLIHYATGRVAATAARGTVLREALLLGVVLPDLTSKAFDYAIDMDWAANASHAPLLWAAMAYVAAHLFRAPLRPAAFAGLLLGGWLHIAVDLGKETMGRGAITLGYPFSLAWQDLGWYTWENTIMYAPWGLGAILAVEGVEWWRRRNPARPK